jgi:hypothetical protein
MKKLDVGHKIIYQVLYGSDAYGTTTNDSDNDVRGIFLPEVKEMLSFNPPECWRLKDDSGDYVFYDIRKFFKLAVESNPGVFEWLSVPSQCIQINESEGKMIRNSRVLFMSKRIYDKFKGYAYSEFSSLTKLTGKTGEKRRKQILQYGYSPKNAMNCIRLLEQGVEMLKTANLIMPRPNCQELVEIKTGKWTYGKITRRFDDLLKELDSAYKVSKLPDKPRVKDAEDLMLKIILKKLSKI